MSYSKARLLNLVDSSLTSLKLKGNLDYVNEVYNPKDFFTEVHHISLSKADKSVKLRNSTIKVHIVKILKSSFLNPINIVLLLLQIISISIKSRITIIRGRSVSIVTLIGMVASHILGIPFIVSIGANNRLIQALNTRYGEVSSWRRLRFLLLRIIEILVIRGADYIISPTYYLRRYAIDIGASEDKIRLIPWILKSDFFFAPEVSSIQ